MYKVIKNKRRPVGMQQCLLFDCDGTLVDSERLCSYAIELTFQEYGVLLNTDELLTRFRGWKLAHILETLAQEQGLTLNDQMIEAYRLIVTRLFETQLKPVEGIEEALAALNQPMAVVSSGPQNKIQQALRVCRISHHFEGNIYSAYDIGIWKPDPKLYLHAAADMGFKASQCVVIEDSLVGVEAGFNAGMKTLFYNPFDESCMFEGVISFKEMKQLASLLK